MRDLVASRPITGLSISQAMARRCNAFMVYPDTDLQAAYDWLKSADRDSSMGTLSETNRRYLMRMPGTYAGSLSVDTKYVHLYDYPGVIDQGTITYTNAWYGTPFGTGSGDSLANAINLDSPEAYHALTCISTDWSKYFLLTADIDFAGGLINPFGSTVTRFGGVLNGNGHTIRNAVVKSIQSAYNSTAMIRHTQSGSIIKDLTIENVTVLGASPYAGLQSYCAILAGENAYGSLISNCSVKGALKHRHTNQFIGAGPTTSYSCVGIIAGANHGTVINCTAGGVIDMSASAGGELYIGGLVGYQTGGTSAGQVGTSVNCKSTTTINVTDPNATFHVGGIAGGTVVNSGVYNTLVNCHWQGVIDYKCELLKTGNVGGICGTNYATIQYCSSKGIIRLLTVTGAYLYAGGGVGQSPANSIIDDSFADCDISCAYGNFARIGGFIGQSTTATIRNCYAFGSFFDLNSNNTVINFTIAGGFCAACNTSVVTNCWAALDAYSAGNASVRGFGSVTGTPSGLFWDTTSSGISTANTNATGKTTAEMMTTTTFGTYDFDLTGGRKWKQVTGYEYPKLNWQ